MDIEHHALLGKTPEELKTIVTQLGMPTFTARQIAQWLYEKHVSSIDQMTNLSLQNRAKLAQQYQVGAHAPEECAASSDGTKKYLYKTPEGSYIETVYIPDGERATLCVSSQVGCKMNCLFCMTGKQGFSGHLSVTEILNQIYALPEREKLTNIVFMGQGEPLDNVDQVLKAIQILTHPQGYAWSPKRITLSSVGLKKGLRRFLDESDCHLAISLHASSHEQRLQLMPAEKAYPIEDLVTLLRSYDFSHQRRLSFEYIVFKGVNDTPADARRVAQLLRGLDCRVNLIRYHRIPIVPLDGADEDTMTAFRDYLTKHGIFTTIRASRGEDIKAACGLLSTAKQQGVELKFGTKELKK
jgi:23S rRNA (adenine2503-C2)-methyltransferase